MPQPDEEKIGEAIDAQVVADQKYAELTTAQKRLFRLSQRWRSAVHHKSGDDTDAGEEPAT